MNQLSRFLTFTLFILLSIRIQAQDTTAYINSDDIMAKGIELHDAEEYDEALAHYRLIVPGDSNYAWSLSEEVLTLTTKSDFEAAISLAQKGLELQSNYKASFYDMMGTAYDYNGEADKALATYEEGLKSYPYHKLLLYNYGVTLKKEGFHKKAQEYFIRRLQLDPFHANSHLQLAELSVLQGFRTKALLSYLMYISIRPSDTKTIGDVENLLNDRVESEGSVKPFSSNGFEDLDALIRSKIATKKDIFKPSVDLNYRITRHAEVMMKRLQYDETSDDFWMKVYVPFFNVSKDKKLNAAMLYNLVSGAGEAKVEKWMKDNAKKVEALQTHAQNTILNSRLYHRATVLGKEDLYRFWYYEDGELNAIGNSNEQGEDIGPYIYYYNNAEVSTTGMLNNQGKKVGDWSYYNPDGSLSGTETFNDQGNIEGLSINYFATGGMRSEVPYTNGVVNGTIKIYNECGSPSEEYQVVNDNMSGPGKAYDKFGNLTVNYTMSGGEIDGPYTQYYSSGEKLSDFNYDNGAVDGQVTNYYKNGQIQEQGLYLQGKLDGQWKGYHENGKPQYELNYKMDTLRGKAVYFHENGNKSYTLTYNDQGELQGEYMAYDEDEKPHYKYVYANDLVKSYEYYAKDGSLLSSGASDDKMLLKAFTPDGFLMAEISYEGGKLNGPITYYHPNGEVHYTITGKDGLWDGEYKEYYETGELKIKTTYIAGDNTGWYQEYYKNGQLTSEVMMVKGTLQQRYSTFYYDGTRRQTAYYLDGQLNGQNISYGPAGKLYSIDEYRQGTPVKLTQFDTLGQVMNNTVLEKGSGTQIIQLTDSSKMMERTYECGSLQGPLVFYLANNQIDTRYNLAEGVYHGASEAYYANGQLFSKSFYKEDQLDSTFTIYEPEGQIRRTILYKNGMRNGPDTDFYSNGQIEDVCNFVNDKKDGECKYYSEDGALQMVKVYDKDYGIVGYQYQLPNGELSKFKKIDLKGKVTVKANYKNKKKAVRQTYQKGLLEGKSTFYHPNGKVQSETTFTNGLENGLSITYYDNGQTQIKANYVNGNLEGLLTEYRKDGSRYRTIEYLHDLKNGYETWYNADGSVSKKLLYWNNIIY